VLDLSCHSHLIFSQTLAAANTITASFVIGAVGQWQYATLLAAVIPVSTYVLLTTVRPTARNISGFYALIFLTLCGVLFTLTASLLIMFVTFELLLLVSLYLLRLTAKSDRVLEAVAEMFF